MEFHVSVQPANGEATVVTVQGEVDVYTAPKLREEIQRLFDGGAKHVAVDLAGVAYMDSSGLGVLIGALKRAREAGGNLVVAAPTPRIARILDVTGLSRIFGVRASIDEAVQALKGLSA